MGRIPIKQELSTDILFDKSSWEWIGEPGKTLLDQSADRWYTYLKLPIELIEKIRNKSPRWNGIRMSRLGAFNLPNNNIIMTCSPVNYYNFTINETLNKIPIKFKLEVNEFYMSKLSEQQKIDVITHELGHALGFASKMFRPGTNNYSTNDIVPNAIDAYNDLVNFDNNNLLPLENIGPKTARNHHLQNDVIVINDVSYPGLLNDLMISDIANNLKISKIDITCLVESFGYVEKNPGTNEGDLTLVR
jgi:hypothetical protein